MTRDEALKIVSVFMAAAQNIDGGDEECEAFDAVMPWINNCTEDDGWERKEPDDLASFFRDLSLALSAQPASEDEP